jgi:hypothetical protein
VGTQRLDFAEFYYRSRDDCFRAVLVSVGDQDAAQELPARQRHVVAPRLLLDLDTRRTADALGISPKRPGSGPRSRDLTSQVPLTVGRQSAAGRITHQPASAGRTWINHGDKTAQKALNTRNDLAKKRQAGTGAPPGT